MASVISSIISIFAIVFVGYGAYKMKVLPMAAAGHFSKLLLNVTAPCLVIHTMSQNSFTVEMWGSIKQVLIGGNLFYILGVLLAIPVVGLMRAPAADRGVYKVMLTFTNNGFLGFGVAYAIFGQPGLFYMVIVNVFTSLYVYTIGMFQITSGALAEEQRRSVKETALSMVTPTTVSAVLGIGIFFLSVPIPEVGANLFETLGNMTTPLSMLIIGMQLGESDLGTMLKNRLISITALLRLVLLPVLTFLVAHFTVTDPLIVCILTLTAAMPCGTVPVAIAEEYGKNARLAAELVAVTTFCAVFTLPVTSFLLTYYLNR